MKNYWQPVRKAVMLEFARKFNAEVNIKKEKDGLVYTKKILTKIRYNSIDNRWEAYVPVIVGTKKSIKIIEPATDTRLDHAWFPLSKEEQGLVERQVKSKKRLFMLELNIAA